MDALEARMQFIHVLKALPKTLDVSRRGPGTSRTPESAAEASGSAGASPTLFYMAHYAEHYEDLQQCMMDTMNKMDVLDRLYMAIYYHRLVEELSAAAALNSATAAKVLSQVLLPALPRVYELACPLEHLQALTNQPELLQLFEELKRELGDRAAECGTVLAEVQLYLDRTQELKQRLMDQFARTGTLGADPTSPLASQIVLNRMEMDRDRHKKQKEQSWHVHRAADPLLPEVNGMLLPREFDALWDATPALTPSDARDAAELHAIAAASYRAD